MEKECLYAFDSGKKEEALKLLQKLKRSNPETIRDSRYGRPGRTLVHHAAYNDWEDACKLLVGKVQL